MMRSELFLFDDAFWFGLLGRGVEMQGALGILRNLGIFGGRLHGEIKLCFEIIGGKEGLIVVILIGIQELSRIHFKDVFRQYIEQSIVLVLQLGHYTLFVSIFLRNILHEGSDNHGFLLMVKFHEFLVFPISLLNLVHYSNIIYRVHCGKQVKIENKEYVVDLMVYFMGQNEENEWKRRVQRIREQRGGSESRIIFIFLYFLSIERKMYTEEGSVVKYTQPEQLPARQRKRTDVCCCYALLIYIVGLAIALAILYNPTNLAKITYPTDQQGRLCGYDLPNYPYVYYASPTNPTHRLCVSACPTAGQTVLQCMPTQYLGCRENASPLYEVLIYNSYLNQGKIGLFCLPTDPALRSQILGISGTQRKYALYSVMDTFFLCAWISAIMAVVSFLIIQYQPYKTVSWTILLGGIFSLIFGIMVLFFPGYLLVRIILCVLFLGMGIISLRSLVIKDRRDSVAICANFLQASTLTHYNRERTQKDQLSCESVFLLWKPLLFIVVFIIIYILFFIIIVLEVLAAWSYGTLVFTPSQPFYSVTGVGSIVAMALVLFKLLWVISFLRQSFNFIAGSHAIYWYFNHQDQGSLWDGTKMLTKYHMGSVAASSFLNGIFYFIDLLVDFFIPQQQRNQKPAQMHQGKKVKPPFKQIGYDRYEKTNSNCIKDLFNLIRGQVLYYVALVNIPYCNAARYCQFLRNNSSFYYYSELTNRLFRINSHIVPIFIVLIIGIFNMGPSVTSYAIMIITVLVYFIVTFFLSYHLSKADALLISTYTDQALTCGQIRDAPDLIVSTYYDDMYYNFQDKNICQLLCENPKDKEHQIYYDQY